MRRWGILLAAAVALFVGCSFSAGIEPSAANPAESFYVAFWNVENLFNTEDDPVEGDEEFTPAGPKQWTPERLKNKLGNLSRVIADMNGGRGPDVLGLCEVEGRDVVELLVAELRTLPRDYRIVHRDSPSFRGIDCALIYDARMFELEDSRFLTVPDIATRDIVEARLCRRDSSDVLTVFVNHWPSQANPESHRVAAATTLRKRIDHILGDNPGADFLVLGDLNEQPGSEAVSKHLRTWSDPADLRPGVLFNAVWDLHRDPRRGSYVYRNRWEVLDYVIASPGLLDERSFRLKRDSVSTIARQYQLFHSRAEGQIPRPNRTYTGNRYHADGTSDHLPIVCQIDLD